AARKLIWITEIAPATVPAYFKRQKQIALTPFGPECLVVERGQGPCRHCGGQKIKKNIRPDPQGLKQRIVLCRPGLEFLPRANGIDGEKALEQADIPEDQAIEWASKTGGALLDCD